MCFYRSSRANYASVALLGMFIFGAEAMLPSLGYAAGAFAVALPDDVAKSGFSYGYSNGSDDVATADTKALDACRDNTQASGDAKLRSLCKVIMDYANACIAVSMDPAAGTPGVGWGIAADKRTAEGIALKRCEAVAGQGRAAACVVDHSGCDGGAQ